MKDDCVEVRICGAKADTRICALFFGAEGHTFVMHVDRTAFAAISNAIQGTPAARPTTHDLMRNLLLGLDCTLDYAAIVSVDNGVFEARLRVSMRNEVSQKILELQARPSDAVALALAMRRPILCARSVLAATPDMTEALKKIHPKH